MLKRFLLPLISAFALTTGAQAAFDPSSVVAKTTVAAVHSSRDPSPTIILEGYYSPYDGGGGQLNYVASDTTSADDGVRIFVDAAGHRYYRQLTGIIGVKQGGAKCDGATDDTSRINATITSVSAISPYTVTLPGGTCHITNTLSLFGGIHLEGNGVGVSNLTLDDSAASAKPAISYYGSATSNISLTELSIIGSWNTTHNDTGSPCVELDNVTNVVERDISCRYARGRGIICNSCSSVSASGIYVADVARDPWSCSDCSAVSLSGLRAIHSGDDCFAWHVSNAAAAPVRSGLTASNIYCEDTTGIKALGMKEASLSNVVVVRPKGYCLDLTYDSSFQQGYTAGTGVSIDNFSCTDVLNSNLFGGGTQAYCFRLGSFSQAGSGTLPGRSTGSTIQTPWASDWTNGAASGTTTVAPGHGLVFSNFTCARTLPSGSAYSAWGFNTTGESAPNAGKAFTATGWVDPTITENGMSATGVFIYGGLQHALIGPGFLMPGAYGLVLSSITGDYAVDDVDVRWVKFKNTLSGGLVLNTGSTLKANVLIEGNEFDCDPFFQDAGHNTNGTWNNAATTLAAIDLSNNVGAVEGGNHFQECYQGVRNNGSTVYQQTRPDIYYGIAVAQNYNSGNVGMGTFTPGQGYVAMNFDGTSANYRQMLSAWPLHSAAAPSGTMYHIQGQIVRNDAPVCSASSLTAGWEALLTNSSNTLGTDFVAIKYAC